MPIGYSNLRIIDFGNSPRPPPFTPVCWVFAATPPPSVPESHLFGGENLFNSLIINRKISGSPKTPPSLTVDFKGN